MYLDMFAVRAMQYKAIGLPSVSSLLILCSTVEIALYDHPLVEQKPVLKGRWFVKRGSLRQTHAKSTLPSPRN